MGDLSLAAIIGGGIGCFSPTASDTEFCRTTISHKTLGSIWVLSNDDHPKVLYKSVRVVKSLLLLILDHPAHHHSRRGNLSWEGGWKFRRKAGLGCDSGYLGSDRSQTLILSNPGSRTHCSRLHSPYFVVLLWCWIFWVVQKAGSLDLRVYKIYGRFVLSSDEWLKQIKTFKEASQKVTGHIHASFNHFFLENINGGRPKSQHYKINPRERIKL